MITNLKLLVETPDVQDFEYIVEEKNANAPSTMYIRGPYMMAESINKNKRRYPLNELVREVERYKKEMVLEKRAMGELNHPASAEVNLERACHVITELSQDGNTFIGKSKILSSPMGLLVKSLITDGVKIGMSSRALGHLIEEGTGVNRVENLRLVAVDCVADPSATSAFVSGILESKQYILNSDGSVSDSVYEQFERAIEHLPRKDVEKYLTEQIIAFIAKIK